MSETWLLTKIVALENLHNALVDRVAVLEKEVRKLKQRKPPAPSHVPPPKYGPTHRQHPPHPFDRIQAADKKFDWYLRTYSYKKGDELPHFDFSAVLEHGFDPTSVLVNPQAQIDAASADELLIYYVELRK